MTPKGLPEHRQPLFLSNNTVARPSTATAPNYAETSRLFYNGVLTGETDALTAFEEMELDMVDRLGYKVGSP